MATKKKTKASRNGQAPQGDSAKQAPASTGEIKVPVADLPRAERSMSQLLALSSVPFKVAYTASRNLDWIRQAQRTVATIIKTLTAERQDLITRHAALKEDGTVATGPQGKVVWKDPETGREVAIQVRALDRRIEDAFGTETVELRCRPLQASALLAVLTGEFPGTILDAPAWLIEPDLDLDEDDD